MAKSKRPSYYAAPLRSKTAIIEWLMEHQSYHGYHQKEGSPLAWDVKAGGVDLTFNHLITLYRTSGEYGRDEQLLDYKEWREPALAKYKEVENDLLYWGIEGARRNVEDDTNKCLWKGTLLDVEYGFAGRSGGWLLMARFEGTKLQGMDDEDFHNWLLHDVSYATLRNLYELVVQNDHDFATEQVEAEVEYHAAFDFVENACHDIPRPDRTQAELPLHI